MLPRGDHPSGLRGWLLLPAIGLALTPIVTLVTVFRYALPALEAAMWSHFGDLGKKITILVPKRSSLGWPIIRKISVSLKLWNAYLIFETFVTVALIVVPIFLLILLFQKKRALPKSMVWCILALLLVRLVDMVFIAAYGASTVRLGGFPETARLLLITSIAVFAAALATAAIWVPYFRRSRRVTNTFLREWSSERGGFWT
jgi:hypothetical protein